MRTFEEQRTAAEKIIDANLKERVLRGLDLLREEYGEDWVRHITPQTLDLGSGERCVLAQVENATHGGFFQSAIYRIDGALEEDGPDLFGFEMGDGISYADLQNAWELVIGIE